MDVREVARPVREGDLSIPSRCLTEIGWGAEEGRCTRSTTKGPFGLRRTGVASGTSREEGKVYLWEVNRRSPGGSPSVSGLGTGQ